MFKTLTVFTALLALPLAAIAQTPAPAPGPVLAIENVTVIPMDSERVLRDHTVVVEGRRITAVGPARASGSRKGPPVSRAAAGS